MKSFLSSFVPFIVIYFVIRDILLQSLVVLNHRYITDPGFNILAEVALHFIFTSGVAFWYVKKFGSGEYALLKGTMQLVVFSLMLVFSTQFLLDSIIGHSDSIGDHAAGIFGYQFLSISWQQIEGSGLTIHAGKYPLLLAVGYAVILAPVFESILTIGLLQKPLYQKVSSYKAILIAAAVFSLLHWSLEKIPFAFVSGLLYGYLYYKTGKLIYPILAHSFNNLLGTFLTYTPHYMNLETAVTLFVAVACFVVSLRYVVRFCSKAEAASTAGVNEEATKEL